MSFPRDWYVPWKDGNAPQGEGNANPGEILDFSKLIDNRWLDVGHLTRSIGMDYDVELDRSTDYRVVESE